MASQRARWDGSSWITKAVECKPWDALSWDGSSWDSGWDGGYGQWGKGAAMTKVRKTTTTTEEIHLEEAPQVPPPPPPITNTTRSHPYGHHHQLEQRNPPPPPAPTPPVSVLRFPEVLGSAIEILAESMADDPVMTCKLLFGSALAVHAQAPQPSTGFAHVGLSSQTNLDSGAGVVEGVDCREAS